MTISHRLGPMLARARGASVGEEVRLALSVELFNARAVSIGARSEVRRNSTLEVRREQGGSILIGCDCRLKENVWIASYGGNVEIGNGVLIGRNTVIHGHGGVKIGSTCMLGPNVTILTAEHGHLFGEGHPPFQVQPETSEPVDIAENVWIGTDTTIVGGVSICSGVVVAAGGVVLKPIAEPGVYAGVPVRRVSDTTQLSDVAEVSDGPIN